MYSKEWKKAANNAKDKKEFTIPENYYPEDYMPSQADLIDTIDKLISGVSNKDNIQKYINAASENENSSISYYIMHCIGWAIRAENLDFVRNDILIPENLYSEKYFRNAMHYYIEKGQSNKFIDFCISQSILYKRIDFENINEAIKNLRNVIYSYDINKDEKDKIFMPFLYDLSITEDTDIPNGYFQNFWYWVTGNNAWQTDAGKTKYAVMDADTARWMYSTGISVADGEIYSQMEDIRKASFDKLNNSDEIYKEVWKENLPNLINLIILNPNSNNTIEDHRDSFGEWTDIIIAVFSIGEISSYGNSPDLSIEQRKNLISIFPNSFKEAIAAYPEILDTIKDIPAYDEIYDFLKSYINISLNDINKENLSDNIKKDDDPLIKRNGSMDTLDNNAVEELSQNLSEYNNINNFFSQ